MEQEKVVKVFISYNHNDADLLEEKSLLGYLKGLENEGVEFWWDKAIEPGVEWDQDIKNRIKEADIALVLVSQRFLDSSYCVDTEINEFFKNDLIIFPIIVSACEWEAHDWLKKLQFLPSKSETIRENYIAKGRQESIFLQIRKNLKTKIEYVRQRGGKTSGGSNPISERTFEFLEELRKVKIPILFREPIEMIKTLKQLPRLGKKKRIVINGLNIPIRSVYDHLESMGHTADLLRGIIDPQKKQNEDDIARSIIFHDIGEVLVGDYPLYTTLDPHEYKVDPISTPLHPSFSWERNHNELNKITEAAARFISFWLDKRLQKDFMKAAKLLKKREGIGEYIRVIDKIDPIIATWRYIHQFRSSKNFSAEIFLSAMRDFFRNPELEENCKLSNKDDRIIDLVKELKNQAKARSYFADSNILKEIGEKSRLDAKVVSSLIEGRRLGFVEATDYK